MNLEKSLNYVTHHSESIIQWLFLAILLMVALLITRWLFGKPEAPQAASPSLGSSTDIQEFLQKILAQTTKLEAVPLAGMSAAAVGDVDAQVQALKKELTSREAEIQNLKAAGDQKPSADADALGARIKELEAKLSEYEILEDDIADLSLYKEENARLKGELEKMKGNPSAEAPAATPEPEPAPTAAAEPPPPAPPEPPGEAIVAEFAQAVSASDPAPAPAVEAPKTEDPVADFASAVAIEKKLGGEAPAAVAPTPSAAPAPAASGSPHDAPATPDGEDLFAEFGNEPAESKEAKTESEGGLDTDKMMAEMAHLVNADAAAQGGGGLEATSDIEKMALEATNLTKS